MSAVKRCVECGREFHARRSDAKFHNAACRQKHFQNLLRQPAPKTDDPGSPTSSPAADAALVTTVRMQLQSTGQLQSVDGQLALQVAEHLCQGGISGAERASLIKALDAAMGRVMRAAGDDPTADPVHILQQRMAAKLLIASGRVEEGEAMLAYWMQKWEQVPLSVRDPTNSWLT